MSARCLTPTISGLVILIAITSEKEAHFSMMNLQDLTIQFLPILLTQPQDRQPSTGEGAGKGRKGDSAPCF